MNQPLDNWLKRLESGMATAADLQRLREILTSRDSQVVQWGKYNINIGQGQEIQIGDKLYVEINDEAVRAIATAIHQQSQSLNARKLEAIDFQPYLQSILDDDDYREWQDVYTPTTVEGHKAVPKPKFSTRLKLRVETVKLPKDERSGEEAEGREQVEQWNVLEGLRNYAAEHVLLIGKPGSGKSVSLERLLWEEADDALQDPAAKIPVLVKLRRCTSTIEHLIQVFFSRHRLSLEITDIENLLQQGKLLLLLDGLNELSDAFGIEMANFRDRHLKTTPMILSTRELNIGGTLGITKTLKMLPLTEPQMQEFVQGYLGEEGGKLFQQLKGDRLRRFAETPLLLWMLCRIFADECIRAEQEKRTPKLPENLGLAFREFTQLYDYQIQEDVPAKSREQWTKLLCHLAFALMHDKDRVEFRLSMSRREAEDLLTERLQQEDRDDARRCAERWLQDLLDYHLLQPVNQPNFEEHIEFRHQLIQEYYAAEYLLWLLPQLADEQLKRNYLNLLKWTEPISLMLALVSEEAQALRVVELALQVDLVLCAKLIGMVQQSYQSRAVELIAHLDDLHLLLKIKLLGFTRSLHAVPQLHDVMLKATNTYSRQLTLKTLSETYPEESISLFERALYDNEISICKSAVRALFSVSSSSALEALEKAVKSGHRNVSTIKFSIRKIINSKDTDQALLVDYPINFSSYYEITKSHETEILWRNPPKKDTYVEGKEAEKSCLDTIELGTKAFLEALTDKNSLSPAKLTMILENTSEKVLPDLIKALRQNGAIFLIHGISSIQSRCKFYNYEIFHSIISDHSV